MPNFNCPFNCPKCNEKVFIPEGIDFYECPFCDYMITVSYKIEKIDGDPVSYLLKRAEGKAGIKIMEQQNQFKKEQKIVDEFFKGLPEESFPIIIRKLIIKQGELEEKITKY